MTCIIKNALDVLAPTNGGQRQKHTPLPPKSQRIVVNGVDIDLLHWVIANRPFVGRGMGKTFARVQEFIGLIELGYTDFCLIVSEYRDCTYLNRMIFDQFHCRGIVAKFIKHSHEIRGDVFNANYITERDLNRLGNQGLHPELIYLRYWD